MLANNLMIVTFVTTAKAATLVPCLYFLLLINLFLIATPCDITAIISSFDVNIEHKDFPLVAHGDKTNKCHS